jgi:hypothetical protein
MAFEFHSGHSPEEKEEIDEYDLETDEDEDEKGILN